MSYIAAQAASRVHYRRATIDGRSVFYREAGDPAAPAIVLLHGFPTSSHMFRDLIPALADRFHVIAPDYIGFGQSDAPSATEFDYTFENLTRSVAGLVDHLGLASYILYMQDYGGPVGFRIFAERPAQVAGFVIQNTNAYLEGVGEPAKQVFLPLWEDRNAATEAAARQFLARDHPVPVHGRRKEPRSDQPGQLGGRPGPARSPRNRRLPARSAGRL